MAFSEYMNFNQNQLMNDERTLTCRFMKVFVTMNVHAQLKAVEKEAAGPKSIYIFQKDLCIKFLDLCLKKNG